MSRAFVLILAWFSLMSGHAAIFDERGRKIPDRDAPTSKVAWKDFIKKNELGLSGVGVLGAPFVGDVCTAFLVDTGHAEGPAYVLTNGHCNFFAHYGFDFLGPTEFREHQTTSFHVTFNHYPDVPTAQRKIFPLNELTFVTESGTDMALYRLRESLTELRAQGIRPLRLSSRPSVNGARVALIGAPLYYVLAEQKSLHISYCTLLGTVALKNGTYSAPESVAHQCSSLPGLSGGPLVDLQTREVVLLNSHGSDDASAWEAPCSYESRPCEVRPGRAPVVNPAMNYGQRVDRIAGCFDAWGAFNRTLKNCGLLRL